jgi:hypothetical protein
MTARAAISVKKRLHADASADRAFAPFVDQDQPEELRKKASFWLGAARGKNSCRKWRMAIPAPKSVSR